MEGAGTLPACFAGLAPQDLQSSAVLFLKSRGITDSDCAAIAPYLSQNTALRQLYIGYNDFGDDGAKHLCQALSSIQGGQLRAIPRRPGQLC